MSAWKPDAGPKRHVAADNATNALTAFWIADRRRDWAQRCGQPARPPKATQDGQRTILELFSR
jgi:hypothetical protein